MYVCFISRKLYTDEVRQELKVLMIFFLISTHSNSCMHVHYESCSQSIKWHAQVGYFRSIQAFRYRVGYGLINKAMIGWVGGLVGGIQIHWSVVGRWLDERTGWEDTGGPLCKAKELASTFYICIISSDS